MLPLVTLIFHTAHRCPWQHFCVHDEGYFRTHFSSVANLLCGLKHRYQRLSSCFKTNTTTKQVKRSL